MNQGGSTINANAIKLIRVTNVNDNLQRASFEVDQGRNIVVIDSNKNVYPKAYKDYYQEIVDIHKLKLITEGWRHF